MKKINKITAVVVLGTMLLTNISLANAEWKHSNESIYELHNGFPLFMTKKQKNANKDKQLCKIGTSFDILNDDGTVKYTYYPQGCQPKMVEENIYTDNTESISNENNNWVDGFINNLFWDKIIDDNTEVVNENNVLDDNSLDILDNLFWEIPEKDTENDMEFSSVSETDTSDGSDTLEINSWDAQNAWEKEVDLDEIFKLFWKNTNNTNVSLKGSKFVKTIRDFNKEKIKIRVGTVEANVLANNMEYNKKVAILLKQIDKDLKIDSIKNSLAKNISNVSYSLSTYRNTTDAETKEVFKNKLVKDLQILKKKYKILKNKDAMISATLEKRGQL